MSKLPILRSNKGRQKTREKHPAGYIDNLVLSKDTNYHKAYSSNFSCASFHSGLTFWLIICPPQISSEIDSKNRILHFPSGKTKRTSDLYISQVLLFGRSTLNTIKGSDRPNLEEKHIRQTRNVKLRKNL